MTATQYMYTKIYKLLVEVKQSKLGCKCNLHRILIFGCMLHTFVDWALGQYAFHQTSKDNSVVTG